MSNLFSFIIPTRKRISKLQRLFSSIYDTTTNISHLEILLAIDEDDLETQEIEDTRLNLKKIVVPRGQTMGFLNQTCYRESSGKYVMLMNDDVILRTDGWDLIVRRCFEDYQKDEIVLIHVNDLIFKETLCTFPFVTRNYCELMGGICPEDYVRYRIDDHVYNIFNMLACMGYKRTIYLPDVIFEHDNYIKSDMGQRNYVPNEEILRKDKKLFDELLPARKMAAIKLARHIESINLERKIASNYKLLSQINESYTIRRLEFVKVRYKPPLSTEQVKVTIGIITTSTRT